MTVSKRLKTLEQSRLEQNDRPTIRFHLPKMQTMEQWNQTVTKVKETANNAQEAKGVTP
jgi:hypothetical protein